MLMRLTVAIVAVVYAVAWQAQAQTIYPIDRADILASSRFDLKVEFPAGFENEIDVTINGKPAEDVVGVKRELARNEDGSDHSAIWLKGASISIPGNYEVVARTQGGSSRVTWTVFDAPTRAAKNVILLIGDGMSMAHRTAARMLSKGITQGKYNGELAMDSMPNMALVSTAGTDSIITDSANSMSAYTTGHKTCVNAIGVYCALNQNPFAHPRVENLTELVKRKYDMAVGVVTNAEIEDATPAGMVAHTRRRAEMSAIVAMFEELRPDVILGGGSAHFLPKSDSGKRDDNADYVSRFKAADYAFATTKMELAAIAAQAGIKKVLGLFNSGDIDGALDLKFLKKGTVAKFPDQPDLVDQTRVALEVLSRSDKGFLLMVESARIDKYSHALDWERAVYDTIMFDNAVSIAREFAAQKNDTLVIVVPDHGHPVSIVGTYDDARSGDALRSKLGVYENAGYPNYAPPDQEGYPPTPDVSRRLAFVFGAFPDHCRSGKPSLAGEFVPSRKNSDGTTYVANEENCVSAAARITGNIPATIDKGVHAGDDVVLTAIGPGSEMFKGHIDNTYVFRVIATALGLAK